MSSDLFGDEANFNSDDPVAEFLAREKAELDKIENNDFANDDFGGFGKLWV
jgi:hypothetical protein